MARPTPAALRTQAERLALLDTIKYCPICSKELRKMFGANSDLKTCPDNHGTVSVSARKIDGTNFRVFFDKTTR